MAITRRRTSGRRRKVCIFCKDKVDEIDYYDHASIMKRFLNERGKIVPRRVTGTCAGHQRQVTSAVRRARVMALLPYLGG